MDASSKIHTKILSEKSEIIDIDRMIEIEDRLEIDTYGYIV